MASLLHGLYQRHVKRLMKNAKIWMSNLVGLILGLSALTAQTAKADSVIVVNPTATYLRTNDDPGSQNTIPISLSALGLQPGDQISMQALGDFCYYSPDCFKFLVPAEPLFGVFSTSNVLLSSSLLNRVAGAIGGVGTPVVSGPTWYGGLPTDIPQDFLIPQIPGATEVTIPAGAAFLFVTAEDSLYGDNSDSDHDLAVHISLISRVHVAEPSSLVLLLCGSGLTLIVSLLIVRK